MEDKIKPILNRYGLQKSFLVPILQDVQKEFNYLPEDALICLASLLEIPISHIYEVATFYKAFSLKPLGKNRISICLGTACHVRGAPVIKSHIERTLGIEAGETSSDLEFTFESVNCLGACALGPVLVVNDEYHGQITIAKTNKILNQLGKKATIDE